MHVSSSAKLIIDNSTIALNNGTVVGGILVDDNGQVFSNGLYLKENEAKEQATSIYVTGQAVTVFYEMKLIGRGYDEKYRDYLLHPDRSNHTFNEDDLAKIGAIKMDGKTFVFVTRTNFSGNAAKYGAVLVAEEAVVYITNCDFEKNAAINGAGVYIEGGNGSVVHVKDSKFVSNIARNGGAVVSAGVSLSGPFLIMKLCIRKRHLFRR